MKGYFKVLSLILAISLLCSCGKTANNNSQGTLNSVTNESNTSENNVSESAIPEAMATFSKEKKSHSYGVAKDGKPHEISATAQKYFEDNSFNAFCLDTVSQNKVLYLTFDCGYENGYTSKILDVLKEKNVPAAFFCTLNEVKDNKELINRMIAEGHIVGNHSVTHPSFAEISREQMKKEIQGFENYLKENFNGYCEPYFRFPKGEYTDEALNLVGSLGYSSVFWSLSYADWDTNAQKGADYAYKKVISRLHPGAVILLHSVSSDNAGAMAKIIDEARAQGYEFKSLRDFGK